MKDYQRNATENEMLEEIADFVSSNDFNHFYK